MLDSVPNQASVDVLEVRSTVGRLYSAIVTDVVGGTGLSHPRVEFIRKGGRAFLSEVWEAGKAGGCRLKNHPDSTQAAAIENDKVTLIASSDWR
ncbi:MAG: hypothetical protein WAN60_20595 [Candidatus Sulfotelmatobacter sp.]